MSAVTRLNDAPRLRRGATCARAAWCLSAASGSVVRSGDWIGVSPVKENSRAAASNASISAAVGPDAASELRHRAGSADDRLERTRRIGSGALVDDGLEQLERLGGHQNGVEHRRRRGARRRRGDRSSRRASAVTIGLLGGLTALRRLRRGDERCLCGGCGERRHDGREAARCRPSGVIGASLRRDAATGAASAVGASWTGAGRPHTIVGRSGAASAVRRRRSAREAPGVSAVAEGGVADERLERRVGADAA